MWSIEGDDYCIVLTRFPNLLLVRVWKIAWKILSPHCGMLFPWSAGEMSSSGFAILKPKIEKM